MSNSALLPTLLKMLNIFILMALLSTSFAAPLDIEENPVDLDKDNVAIDASGPEPSGFSAEVEPKSDDLDLQDPSTDPADRSANVVVPKGSFLTYLECVKGRYPIDPYFDPYFRVKMKDPLYRRLLKQRKCRLLYYF